MLMAGDILQITQYSIAQYSTVRQSALALSLGIDALQASEAAAGRIDVIYADPRFLVRGCAVIRNGETRLASDHYPVAADLVLVS